MLALEVATASELPSYRDLPMAECVSEILIWIFLMMRLPSAGERLTDCLVLYRDPNWLSSRTTVRKFHRLVFMDDIIPPLGLEDGGSDCRPAVEKAVTIT